MPIPPPKPRTEGPRDKQVAEQIAMLRRAVDDQGPLSTRDLAEAVAAQYWKYGVFERALTLALVDGRLVRTADGKLASP